MKSINITLNLTEEEFSALQDLSQKKGMSIESLTKHSLILYQTISKKIDNDLIAQYEFSKFMSLSLLKKKDEDG